MKRAKHKGRTEGAVAEKQLAGFIAKFEPRLQKMITAARAAMRKRLPTANEMVYDNYNFFVIGYGPSERPSEAILSIAADANGLGLAFLHGAELPDPRSLLQGSGKQNRFLRLENVEKLKEEGVEALIGAAVENSKVLFAKSGHGKLIIRSVSAKQRPRRKASKK